MLYVIKIFLAYFSKNAIDIFLLGNKKSSQTTSSCIFVFSLFFGMTLQVLPEKQKHTNIYF